MSWRSIIVTQHAKISYSSRQLVVQTRDGVNEIPIDDIQLLLVSTTAAVITTAAIAALVDVNAKIIFTGRNSEPICETIGYYPNNRDKALIEAQFTWNDELKQILWTKLVIQKIRMQMQVCDFMQKDTVDLADELNKMEVGDASNREAVVAHKYFTLIFNKKFVRREFDPVNSALNYGYSILLAAVNREIVVNGYMTQLGIHHHSEENDFNLGSDLMEPFRPIIDFWVVNHKFKEFTPDIKYALVDLLNFEIEYNDKKTILRNALTKHVANCVNFLSAKNDSIDVKVGLTNEVPNNAINGHV
ncbi:type II CRISPR-associated endonuclease Cas1 [Paucilactobacillus wasatchensis]|uniref:CRISPR-associated endonuclease Cas1 n=1 Tax=Paucilactobacillus wasatchensis TaxID=1335616 RepID=A0A0D1A581_9LACO|nr:type II CRISPR-associated endonuclease Cas1 [Paucilactobacillus wasatchensis]KIS03030.1 CRISPR-associated protein Cas1 [Paucilactobacillus wasatchensis]